MANTFLDNKISSFIEDRFPEFIKSDHSTFVDFLKLYYQFMEAAKITLTNVQASDRILLENLLTDNFVLLEDGDKIVGEDTTFGVFLKGENVTGQTSGAVATILAEDNANTILYVEHNRFLQVGEVVVGSVSGARATISKYQGNPIQNIQQLLEYANIDKTLESFLDQFRDSYLTAVPNTLASNISKRKLVKTVRDLYRAKGTRRGHELFFRLLFGETPEIFYPTDNLLKISAGEWTSNTVIRVIGTANNPANLVGQIINQTVDATIGAGVATATVEGTIQLQEGELTVFELILNLDSIVGTFVTGASISGIDNKNADVAITATVQTIISGAEVSQGGSFYSTSDEISINSVSGKDAEISIVDVGGGELDEVITDSAGINYAIGQDLFFDNTNTEGSGATAIITNVGGAVAPELGDYDRVVGGNVVQGEYRDTITEVDHIIFEPETEKNDPYTGGQISFESATFADLGDQHSGTSIASITRSSTTATVTTTAAHGLISGRIIIIAGATPTEYNGEKTITVTGATTFTYPITGSPSTPAGGIKTFSTPGGRAHYTAYGYEGSQIDDEATEVVNVLMTNKGAAYESPPSVVSTTAKLTWIPGAVSGSANELIAGETVTNSGGASATIASKGTGYITITNVSGTFASGQIITGSTTNAYVETTSYTAHGTGAVFLPWSQSKIGSVKGVEVSKFGTGFATAPSLSLPVKVLVTRNESASSPADLTQASAFTIGDVLEGANSLATGKVVSWDNARQLLTVSMTSGNFVLNELLKRGSTVGYATVTRTSQASVTSTIGTIGTTTGAYENDKGKISESLMKIQDSFYYQDFSYVVRVGAAIADWRGEIKKAVHPAGFAIFGEVSLTNQVETKMVIPVTGISTFTPELASLIEAALTTVVRRKLGTKTDGSTLRANSHLGHELGLISDIETITRDETTVTVETTGPHGFHVADTVEIRGVTSPGYGGVFKVTAVTDDTFTYTVSGSPTTPAVLAVGTAKAAVISPFDETTRDVTLSTHYDIPIQVEILSGFASLRQNRYGLGATKKTATKYLWSVGATSDTTPQRQTLLNYAYPNSIRRKVPETGTDNVTAGSAGVYDTTMNYTTIQIGQHEINSQMTLESFADVRIDEIVRPSRIVDEDGYGNDTFNLLAEDGIPLEYEDNEGHVIPEESGKLWNVPPPSYIRGVNISTGEYVSFDDNTSPPDFSDNTAPPSFDATSGT